MNIVNEYHKDHRVVFPYMYLCTKLSSPCDGCLSKGADSLLLIFYFDILNATIKISLESALPLMHNVSFYDSMH